MKTKSGKTISKIGIGSYGIGGRGHRDMEITEKENDQKYIDALIYTFEQGLNFTEIALGYGQGQSLKIFKEAVDKSNITREDIFLTHSLYPRDLDTINVVKEDIANFYSVMDTDYADSTLVTQSFIQKFGEKPTYNMLHDLLRTNKTNYVSLSNASPAWIKKFKAEFGSKFFAHEGHLSFEIRALQDKGVFRICDELGVKNIIWRPLRRQKTLEYNWPLLAELGTKYNKTQSQIVLNWITNLGYYPMVFSTDRKHIKENVQSSGFKMDDADYQRMTNFRPLNYYPPKINWEGIESGDSIVELAADFEDQIKNT